MAYQAKWVSIENGVTALFIPGVVMASFVSDAERGWTLDDGWWKHAEDTAKQREAKGKFAGLIFKRNTFTHTDPLTAGRFENLLWERPYAKADWVVTDPDEIAAIIRGERTQLSIEAQLENFLVWGVELIQGSEGHFSEDIPEMRVQGVSTKDPQFKELMSASATAARLKAPDSELMTVALSKGVKLMPDAPPPQGGNPPAAPAQPAPAQPAPAFSPEQEARIKDLVKAVIQEMQQGQMGRADIEKLVEAKLKSGAPTKPKSDNPEIAKLHADLDAVNVDKAELQTRLDRIELERKVDNYVAKLLRNGHPKSEDELRKDFLALKTDEGRAQMFERLDAFKLNRDEPPEDPISGRGTHADVNRKHAELKAEWAKKAELWKEQGFASGDEYANFHMTGDKSTAPENLARQSA